MKDFFKDKDAVLVLDAMCQRYGKLPHEVMRECTVEEYNFNEAIMFGAINYAKIKEDVPKTQEHWNKLGIKYTVKKKGE